MEFRITQELARTMLNYLVTQPYSEVWDMVPQLQRLQIIEEKPAEDSNISGL
jgi:hypothetical protein